MKSLDRMNYLLLSKTKTFLTHLMLEILINYYQEIKIDPISTIKYQ